MDIRHWTTLILEKLYSWLTLFVKMLPNLAIAIVVIVVAYFFAKLVRNVSFRVTQRISKSDSISSVVSVILQTLTMFFALTIALGILNLDKTVASLLAGVGIIGLALGFAFQDLSSNFISGLYMAFRRPFEIGDKVETNAFIGTIENIELRSTTIKTTTGLYVIIPNKDIFQKPIINYSRSDNRRVELEFTLPNTTDLSFAESFVRNALKKMDGNSAKEIEFFYTAIEDPKVRLKVSFLASTQDSNGFMKQKHQAILSIHKAFGENNIVKIAVPEHSTT
jgi:small conductance mechanosensitive channel